MTTAVAEPTRPKNIYKLFDRSTPAGQAMYALYNASENEARSKGNAYSRRNAPLIAAQQRRAALKKSLEPEPELEPKKLGPAMSGQVRVPKFGRRKAPAYTAPARPGRRPAMDILGELEEQERAILSEQQIDAARAATQTVDREAAKRKLQRQHELAGMGAAEARRLEAQVRQSRQGAKQSFLPEQDRFDTLMKEIEDRHGFLAEMHALGQAKHYEVAIKAEISERVAQLKEIDRIREDAMNRMKRT